MSPSLKRTVAGLRSERGYTLIESLVAATITTMGIGAVLGIFGSSQRATLASQHHEVAVHQAQAELDKLQLIDYNDLALTAMPAGSSDPNDPGHRIVGSSLQVKSDLQEPLVVSTDPANSGAVDPAPTSFAVGQSSVVTGKVYRFVTWRAENCPIAICDGNQDTKRLTVAVTLDASGADKVRRPVWISSVAVDPKGGPPGSDDVPDATPGSGTPVTAQTFYLYDTPCGETQYVAPTADHATHNTAGSSGLPANQSSCENSDASKQPDLMGSDPPPGDSTTPLFTYSNDLTGSYPGGLVIQRRGSSCPTSYAASDATDPNATNKWNVHAWASAPLTDVFSVANRVAFSVYTQTVGGSSFDGTICATLIDRSSVGGVVTDQVIGATTFDDPTWPSTPTDVVFSFELGQPHVLLVGHRIVMTLSVRGESSGDLAFLYDYPLYESFVQVGTTTPLP